MHAKFILQSDGTREQLGQQRVELRQTADLTSMDTSYKQKIYFLQLKCIKIIYLSKPDYQDFQKSAKNYWVHEDTNLSQD